jgi:hypothetical protein
MIPRIKFCPIILLASLVIGCQNTTTIADEKSGDDTISPVNKQAGISNYDQASLTDYGRKKDEEDMIEKWLRKPLYKYEKEFDQTLLKEKTKFGKMAAACYNNVSSDAKRLIHGELKPIMQLESDIYLIELTCSHGRGANRYSWFIYRSQTGIQSDALKLPIMLSNNLGVISTREETFVFARDHSFDVFKKEITITVPCHFADGHQASRTVYKYENGNIKLVEYWQNEIYDKKCTQIPRLKQLYP